MPADGRLSDVSMANVKYEHAAHHEFWMSAIAQVSILTTQVDA